MSELAINFTGDDEETQPVSSSVATPVASVSALPTAAAPPALSLGSSLTPVLEFEKAPVAKTEIKISGACSVETTEMETVSLDDRLRVCGDFRVIGVRHQVNPKTGDVVRTQIIAPIGDMQLVPWDPANPNDNGIVRARP